MLIKLKSLLKQKEEGFTLIELLVVILIIGILAAIAIPVFLNQRQTANDAAVQSDTKNAATVVETIIASNPKLNSNWFLNIQGVDKNGKTEYYACFAAVQDNTTCYNTTTSTPSANALPLKVTDANQIALVGFGTVNAYQVYGAHSNGKKYNIDKGTFLIYESNKGGFTN